MTNFYEFDQNNSGGGFDVDDKVCHRLFIEAKDADTANGIAQELGVYFNGCEQGIDCNCCGDRWYEVGSPIDLGEINVRTYSRIATELIEAERNDEKVEALWYEKYGKYKVIDSPKWIDDYFRPKLAGSIAFRNIEEYAQFLADEYGWTTPDARIYYADGRVTEIFKGG